MSGTMDLSGGSLGPPNSMELELRVSFVGWNFLKQLTVECLRVCRLVGRDRCACLLVCRDRHARCLGRLCLVWIWPCGIRRHLLSARPKVCCDAVSCVAGRNRDWHHVVLQELPGSWWRDRS